ncbi:MAG: ATP phosphoribosyltransferase [Anaerolineaceae bacterium]|jgi:ATP phosphoribosyltransferase|nr:ATP phosphoribosyltransferase [Anaerolineaceae bacterium]
MNPTENQRNIRISLPSKGRLAEDCLDFLEESGLKIYKPNPRQYEATLPALPGVSVIFQRASDIVTSVQDGSIDFGITGYDVVAESLGEDQDFVIIHDALGFGNCSLHLAIPEGWENISSVTNLMEFAGQMQRPLRIATKYKNLVSKFFSPFNIDLQLISSEGTVEIAPAIGYADMICDVVSSGLTLSDNRLRMISGGKILESEAVLIGNKKTLLADPEALKIARMLIEFFEAHLIAKDKLAVFANMRGKNPQAIAQRIFESTTIAGLQGPTISQVIVKNSDQDWFAVNIIVSKSEMYKAISELRAIGGSGVIVIPVSYVFDEEPPRYRKLLEKLQISDLK